MILLFLIYLDLKTKKKIEKYTGYEDYYSFVNQKFDQNLLTKTLERFNIAFYGYPLLMDDDNHSYSSDIKFALENSPVSKKNISLNKIIELNVLKDNIIIGIDQNNDPNFTIKLVDELIRQINIINSTSVIGTINFIDEISKYNLGYNKSSLVNRYYKKNFEDNNFNYGFNDTYSVNSANNSIVTTNNKTTIFKFLGQRNQTTYHLIYEEFYRYMNKSIFVNHYFNQNNSQKYLITDLPKPKKPNTASSQNSSSQYSLSGEALRSQQTSRTPRSHTGRQQYSSRFRPNEELHRFRPNEELKPLPATVRQQTSRRRPPSHTTGRQTSTGWRGGGRGNKTKKYKKNKTKKYKKKLLKGKRRLRKTKNKR